MKLEAGDAYWDDSSRSSIKHLYFILGVEEQIGNTIVAVVNITSNNPSKEQTCLIYPNEHRNILHESVVYYREARLLIHERVYDDIIKGVIRKADSASQELLDRMIDGGKKSKQIPIEVKRMLKRLYP